MDLSEQRESENVEDSRGNRAPLAVGGGIGALVITLVAGYLGINPQVANQLFQAFAGGGGGPVQKGEPPKDGYKSFAGKILGSTEDVWEKVLPKEYGKKYQRPGMELFRDQVDSGGCGVAPSSVGPFYCPESRKVFLDPTFFEELQDKLGGSKAEFSQAYVIGHEVGHHVQNLLGYNRLLDEFKREGENAGIRLELQADYLAGVWAHYARDTLKINDQDVQEAIKTARAIGDNRIQEKMRGKSWPEKFTHGSDAQRIKYFTQGYKTGDASKGTLDHFFDPKVRPLDL